MFCAQCDIWDSETPEGRERNNGNSRRFGCTARHTSFAFPTDVIKRNCRLEAMNAKPPSDNEDDNTDDDNTDDALIKTFFYRRTNHGGAAGNKGTSKKSRLVPIAHWLQRRMMFLCGYTEDDIDAYIKQNPITGYRTQRIIGATDSDLEEEGDEDMQVTL
jgi:hypothetical protein